MKQQTEVLDILGKHTPLINDEIKSLLARQENLLMYDMMSYFFGYLNEDLEAVPSYGGKRFRPGISLLLADFYGKSKETLGAATAIEIFHNFTLIHDDIEDNDSIRRGKPTLWKKWGLSHGINTGDTQLILAYEELNYCYAKNPELLAALSTFLTGVYKNVAEGQYLDLTLAEKDITDTFITENNYLEMIKGKSAILVAASAKVAGIIAGLDKNELENLWQYGLNLGFAYQLNDDIVSIWGDLETTGKNEAGDIREHKKTLPIIYLYNNLNTDDQLKIATIYNSNKELSDTDVTEIKSLLDEKNVYEYVRNKVNEYLAKSREAVLALNIKEDQKEILLNINKALLPDTGDKK